MKLMLKHKLLMLYIGASLCILIIIGSLLSNALRDTIINTISNGYNEQLTHIDFGLTTFFRNMEHDLENLGGQYTGQGQQLQLYGLLRPGKRAGPDSAGGR